MDNYSIYRDISERTQGDIYLGVVGPVRTGKSTFIKRFMDLLVIPNIENQYQRERTRDELPQSAAGRTVMTTEPKFVPNEAVEIVFEDGLRFNVRLVDCVGYMVRGALGYFEDNAPRMVSTPWSEEQIPFVEAAEIGTRKVINEHSTIGLMVTTDGSITDIERSDYIDAEKRVINELKAIGKPFVVILNSTIPTDRSTTELCNELTAAYNVPVIPLDCARMTIPDINMLLEKVLYEFPSAEIGINLPEWIDFLDDNHWLKGSIFDAVKNAFGKAFRIREARDAVARLTGNDYIKKAYIDDIDAGKGRLSIEAGLKDGLFYRVLSEETGFEIDGEYRLVSLMKDLSLVKKEYDRIEYALNEVRTTGYGIVSPRVEELTLEEPEIIKHGGRFGVKLRASAPSVHMIRCDVETEIAPLVGTEKQSEDLVNYLVREFEGEPERIWESNIFGKSLHELVSEGLYNKLSRMPDDARQKLRETIQRIINEGSGGLICIIL